MRKFGNIILLIVGVLLLFMAGAQHPRLLSLRQEYHLNQAAPLENAPPLVAFTTVALGGFRGLLADLLWMRASTLQDEGQYFELVQLSDWITKLEPRFTTVWAFQAWNMAYNISVLFKDPGDRWRWVRHGITLLRDEGLQYNSGDARLYRELGWMFQHKLAMDMDQAHLYYKQAWVNEMAGLLSSGHPDFATLPPDVVERARQEFKLDTAAMARLDKQYGPLDWSMPQAHAIYWASQGLPFATGFERTALDRMIVQSLADAVREGRWVEGPKGSLPHTEPDLSLIPQAIKAYREVIQQKPHEETFQTAYQNFLRGAVVLLYVSNKDLEAARLLDTLIQEFPTAQMSRNLDLFVVEAYMAPPNKVPLEQSVSAINDVLYISHKNELAGDLIRAKGYERIALLCWKALNAVHPQPPFKQFLQSAEIQQ